MSAIAQASLRAFGTVAVIATTEPAALRPSRRLLAGALRSLDLACSRFRDDSELTALNAAGGRALRVGETLFAAVEAALATARMTGGLVDPTVGRALRLAGYNVSFERLTQRDASRFWPRFEPAGRFEEVVVDRERRMLRLPAGVELDLGASAKAHAADRIAVQAARSTGAGVLVAIGGDLAVAGPPPADGWPVALACDHSALEPDAAVVAIRAGGLASSGTRVRRWNSARGELHHIIDPRSGAPARTPWATVSVAAATCLEANAASTAAVVLGEEASAWLAARRLPARMMRLDGSVVQVAGWPAEAAA